MFTMIMLAAAIQTAPAPRLPSEIAEHVARPRVLANLAAPVDATSPTDIRGGADAPAHADLLSLDTIEVRRREGRTEVLLRGTGGVRIEWSEPEQRDRYTRLQLLLRDTRVEGGARTFGASDDGRVRAITANAIGNDVRVAIAITSAGRYGVETWGTTTLVWIEEGSAAAGTATAPTPTRALPAPAAIAPPAAADDAAITGMVAPAGSAAASGTASPVPAALDQPAGSAAPTFVARVRAAALDARQSFTAIGARMPAGAAGAGGLVVLALVTVGIAARLIRRRRQSATELPGGVAAGRALAGTGASVLEISRTTGMSRDAAALLLLRRTGRMAVRVAAPGKPVRATPATRPYNPYAPKR